MSASMLEDRAVRVMYFLTTLETFLPLAAIPAALSSGMESASPWSWAALLLAYLICRLARLFPVVPPP